MAKLPHLACDIPANAPRRASGELPLPDVTGHDEWLLDEALAATFPASDPIAVTPRSRDSRRPAWLSPANGANAADPTLESELAAGGIANCTFGDDESSELIALATPLLCDLCHSEIPATVAFNFEGADYVYNFCGPQCLADWCKAAKTHDK